MKFGVNSGKPAIVITHIYDQSPVFYNGHQTEDDLVDFAYNESIPNLVDAGLHKEIANLIFEEW